jgi:hydroxymethylglutaryl-CoA lyase
MTSPLPARVTLRDVTLRDGLQDEPAITTAAKVAVFEALVAAGVAELELTSFVRPDRVPAMADADAFAAATAATDVVRWALVLNPRGAERALAAGLRHLQYVVSVSDSHSRGNAGVDTETALQGLESVLAVTRGSGASVELTLATAFGCPHEQRVEPARVVAVACRGAAAGVVALGLADTIGVAVPSEVTALIGAVGSEVGLPLGVHLHDTRGLGVANALAAIAAGVTRVDGSVGGLGGCPFAPGASGNMALEDLAHALEAMGVATGVSTEGLVDAAALACAAVGRPVGSHVGLAGPRFRAARTGVPA